ncbi:unnamed protein product [Prorocentrum cordatum]|uniref:Mannosyltransferase n=1 Tax=Prorocentrum cordatum TaxID=2364126 RepID=A0ABN9X768_9DINO|nr:unnamed protein product [Polarella glacialis]
MLASGADFCWAASSTGKASSQHHCGYFPALDARSWLLRARAKPPVRSTAGNFQQQTLARGAETCFACIRHPQQFSLASAVFPLRPFLASFGITRFVALVLALFGVPNTLQKRASDVNVPIFDAFSPSRLPLSCPGPAFVLRHVFYLRSGTVT